MFILFKEMFLLLLIIQTYFLIKAVRKKDNRYWLVLFSIDISSIIHVIVIGCYALCSGSLEWFSLTDFAICFMTLFVYVIVFIIHVILKIIMVKKKKIITETLSTDIKRKLILRPIQLILIITITVCGIDYSIYTIKHFVKINTYNRIRNQEITKMADFLNNKYNMNIQESDCIYYREQDYTIHSGFLSDSYTANIPYIAVFKINEEEITVVDRKGYLSDNRQLKDLNQLISDYYQEKTGLKFDYIEFSKTYFGNSCGDDNIINIVLQTKFNQQITSENVEEFISYILQESKLHIIFYMKDIDIVNGQVTLEEITEKLDYLKEYSNIEELTVYGYDEELVVSNEKKDFLTEQIDRGVSSDDYYDSYKFGCYYIDFYANTFNFSLTMSNNGYNSNNDKSINGWNYRLLN